MDENNSATEADLPSQEEQSPLHSDDRRRPSWKLVAAGLVAIVGIGLGVWIILMATGLAKVSTKAPIRWMAWELEFQEPAYRFGVVEEGRIYRSMRPDDRFIEYVKDEYGIERIISLNGGVDENPFHERARDLGLEIIIYDWSTKSLPPRKELEEVLALMEDESKPVLVHCSAGKDRSGYVCGAWRLSRNDWELNAVYDEMDRFWHDADDKPWFQEGLKELSKEDGF